MSSYRLARAGNMLVAGVTLLGSAALFAEPLGDGCVYDNYAPLDDFGGRASQLDTAYPFYAEAASDFVLVCDDEPTVIVDTVRFGIVFFGHPFGANPEDCWEGIRVTVYEDGQSFCGAGFVKGPAGEPLVQSGVGLHVEYCPGSIVCEFEAPMDMAAADPLAFECLGDDDTFEVLVSNLQTFACELQTEHKYWLAVAPVQQFAICGQTGIMQSELESGQPDQQIFMLLGLPWTVVSGNPGGCPGGPPMGTKQDFSYALTAVPISPPADLDGDGSVGPADLAILLGAWGDCTTPDCPEDLNGDGEVGPADLAILLGTWG